MIVLIDDIKLNNEAEFLVYINTVLPQSEIKTLEDLSRCLLSADDDIELLVSDLDNVKNKELASRVMQIFTDASDAKSNIRLTKM